MREILYEVWSDCVSLAINSEFPEFVRLKGRQAGRRRDPLKFEWKPRRQLICAIVFRPLAEGFDTWVGWSTNGRFPYPQAMNPAVGAVDPSDVSASAGLFLTAVLSNRQGFSHWNFWQPEDELIDRPAEYARRFSEYQAFTSETTGARAVVAEVLPQAVEELRNFGVPYLRSRSISLNQSSAE